MLTNGCYGYFRDEFYYLAASDHLALGYVDFAPLMAWFTHASRFVFGDSLHAIRLLPAVAFGAEVLLTGFHHAGTRREALGHIARIRLGAARSGHPRQCHASFHESPRAAVLDGLDLFPVPRNPPATAKIAIVVRSAVGLWLREQAFDGVLPERACRGIVSDSWSADRLPESGSGSQPRSRLPTPFRMLPGNISITSLRSKTCAM